jgi:DNA repair photolyase
MQGFMTIDAAVTVEVLDRDERREFQRFADSLRARLDVWESALQQGLHVVGG